MSHNIIMKFVLILFLVISTSYSQSGEWILFDNNAVSYYRETITNPDYRDFENNDTYWFTDSHNQEYANPEYVAGHNSSRAIKFYAINYLSIFLNTYSGVYIADLKKDSTYTISFWYHDCYNVHLTSTQDGFDETIPNTSLNVWAYFEADFFCQFGNAEYFVISYTGGVNSRITIDDFSIKETWLTIP